MTKTGPESFARPHFHIRRLGEEKGTGVDASHSTLVVLSGGEWVWPTLLTGKDRIVNLSDAEMTYILCLRDL